MFVIVAGSETENTDLPSGWGWNQPHPDTTTA